METIPEHVRFRYKNWRGEERERLVLPFKIWFGRTEHHPEPQWLLTAFDVEKDVWREFALKHISNWRAA